MKKISITLILLFFGLLAQAQNLSVKSFTLLPMDMTASSLEGKRIDQNNEVCALIRIVTSETGFVFEAGALGIVDSQQRTGEIWVWVPRASRKITIMHQQLGVLRDYRYPVEIQAERTYEMVLETNKPSPNPVNEVTQQYLIFQLEPKDAILEVDEQPWTVSEEGTARKFVKFGTYTYRVQAPNYYPEAGKVTVNDPNNKQTVAVKLKPNFGWIEVKGNNVQGAAVYVDNALVGKAPCKSDALKSGEHTVKIVREMYAPYTERVTVSDNETTTLSPSLTADFARVTLKVDADAEIWVNEEKKGFRTWTGNLATGSYRIECRANGHETSVLTKEIDNTMDGETITLPAPKPIYGSLNVESTPDFAQIFVDGKPMGETPNYIAQILVGQHELKLTKEGYADHVETIMIDKGERKQVNATMNKKDNNQMMAGQFKVVARAENLSNQSFTVNGVSFTMKPVEGGSFKMGTTSEYDDGIISSLPVHKVALSSFYIGETVVTQALWKAVMGSEPTYKGGWEDKLGKGRDYPAYRVSWDDAQEFINKLNQKTGKNFRLPTEAEWEYAARGGVKTKHFKYPGSDDIDKVVWYDKNSGKKSHPVKTKMPNELGLYDMSGNVWEWCQDWYGKYGSESQVNPTGPLTGKTRVSRGGGYYGGKYNCNLTARNGVHGQDFRDPGYGFRLVLPLNNDNTIIDFDPVDIESSYSLPEGALKGVFSISATNKVHFSKGNLQYQASSKTWRFAEKQWHFVGGEKWFGSYFGNVFENDVQCNNANVSQYYNGWIDLFYWGASNNPTKVSYTSTDKSVFIDWGRQMNKGQIEPWFTLSKEEWNYLLFSRVTESGIRFVKAKLYEEKGHGSCVYGIILLPDNWILSNYAFENPNSDKDVYESNRISSKDWQLLEDSGAVFLPASGNHDEKVKIFSNGMGGYWTRTPIGEGGALYLSFYGSSYVSNVQLGPISVWSHAFAVRLVCPAEN